MRFPRTSFLLEQGELAGEILWRKGEEYYIDKRATHFDFWPLDDGRVLIRVPTFCGLSARYYYCDGREMTPITISD